MVEKSGRRHKVLMRLSLSGGLCYSMFVFLAYLNDLFFKKKNVKGEGQLCFGLEHRRRGALIACRKGEDLEHGMGQGCSGKVN